MTDLTPTAQRAIAALVGAPDKPDTLMLHTLANVHRELARMYALDQSAEGRSTYKGSTVTAQALEEAANYIDHAARVVAREHARVCRCLAPDDHCRHCITDVPPRMLDDDGRCTHCRGIVGE